MLEEPCEVTLTHSQEDEKMFQKQHPEIWKGSYGFLHTGTVEAAR